MQSDFHSILVESAAAVSVPISMQHVNAFALYYSELLAWNAKINLTTITSPSDAAIKHFLDSILIAKHVPATGTLLDVGTGAGFPGLPLKIMNPQLAVVLVESVRKKTSFLKQIIRILGLTGVEVYNGRIEDYTRFCVFDVAVSRAFSELGKFCRLAVPFIKLGGLLLAMKGQDEKDPFSAEEIASLGLRVKTVQTYELPQHKGRRSLVILEKCFT